MSMIDLFPLSTWKGIFHVEENLEANPYWNRFFFHLNVYIPEKMS